MLILHLGDVEGLHNALQAPLLELGALKASQEPLDVLGLQSAEPSGCGLIEAREVARHLVIAELVEALRDLEGLGEHAPPRRGAEDACSLTFAISSRRLCHLASFRVSRRASSKGAAAEGNLGTGRSSSSFARSSSMGTSSSGGFRSSRNAPGGRVRAFGTCATPRAASSIGSSSALRLAGIRAACSSSSALEKNRSSGA